MMRRLLSLLLCAMTSASLFASTFGKSAYTLKPVDSEAVYLSPSGQDMTKAIQAAVNKVKDTYNFGIVYLAPGTYHISGTIYVPPAVRVIGYGKQRPQIVLKRNSPGFSTEPKDDKGKAKYMIWFTGNTVHEGQTPQDATAGTFYSALANINFTIEDGNPYAVALRTHYAQHSYIQHVNINIGKGKAGIFDVGNELEDVGFFGGDYGIYTTKSSPSWQMTILNTRFSGQRKAAIRTQEAGLTIIRMTVSNTPVGIEIDPDRPDRIYLEDCAFTNVSQTAVKESWGELSPNQLSMRNVYLKQTPAIVTFRSGENAINAKKGITHISDFSYGLQMDSLTAKAVFKTLCNDEVVKSIPAFVDDIPDLPDMGKWVNIASLGAFGDDATDNTAVFQRAIEQYETIFVPQGWYRVSQPLKLKANTKLIGMNPISTQIKISNNTDAFSGFGSPVAVIETPVGGHNILSGIGVYTDQWNYRAVGVKWQSAADSYMNDIKLLGFHGTMRKLTLKDSGNDRPQSANFRLSGREIGWDNQHWSLWITNGGGGTFKDIWSANTYAANGIYVSDTSTPSRMYEISVEHHVRNEVSFKNVSNWKVYALQLEEETRESSECQQIELQNCHNMLFANTYLFRVIRVFIPAPYAIRLWGCSDLTFLGASNFTQMQFTTDQMAYDVNRNVNVKPWQLARLIVKGTESGHPVTDYAGAKRLATGFEYAQGICTDGKGNIYFSDTRKRKVYRYNANTNQTSIVVDLPWDPMSLACDTNGKLIVIFKYTPQPGRIVNGKVEKVEELPDRFGTSFSGWGNSGFLPLAYSVDPNNPEATIAPLRQVETSSIGNVSQAFYATHRWRDNHDFDTVCIFRPEKTFVAEDGKTVIPMQYDLCRTTSVIPATPGKPFYEVDEWAHRTVKYNVSTNGALTDPQLFANHGENGLAVDEAGNVYIAEGDIYVYNPEGKLLRTIATAERPCALVVTGGKLYYAGRTSLYEIDL